LLLRAVSDTQYKRLQLAALTVGERTASCGATSLRSANYSKAGLGFASFGNPTNRFEVAKME
jgi:hypothetical protein